MVSEKQIEAAAKAMETLALERGFVPWDEAASVALTAAEQAEPVRWAGTLPDAHKLAMEYEFRGDNGDYTPTEAERVMLEDFGNCLLSEIEPAPAARSGAVKVKQLEWEETHTRRSEEDPTTEWDGGFEADSALGYYKISMGFGSDAYYWAVTNPLGDDVGSDFEDPLHAKAAAQQDYERRILSALEPAETATDAEPVAWLIHAPEDDYYGIGPVTLQFNPLEQWDLDKGYTQTPLYTRRALEAQEQGR